MFANINVDCCKTPGCKNLGVLNSPDYVRQGKDVLCRECGFLFPVISAGALNLFRHTVNRGWKGLVKQCPACGSTSLKKYGFSTQGEHRMACSQCRKTFIVPEKAKSDCRQDELATLIEEGTSLAGIRSQLKLDSTGLNRALFKLSRNANLAERCQQFPASISHSAPALSG